MRSDPMRSLAPAAAAFGRRLFGAATKPISTTITVAATRTTLLKNNPNRLAWLIMNRDVVNSAIDTDSGLTFANGTKLGADGGFATMSVAEDGEAVTYEVFGIASSGTAIHRVVEIVASDPQES